MAKRNRHKNVSALAALIESMRADSTFKRHKLVVSPPGEANMSEVVAELIDPYLKFADTYDAYQKLITTACIAWDMANLPEGEKLASINQIADTLSDLTVQDREDMTEIILELIRRKELLFPDNHRMIVNFEITESGNNFHVAIASTLKSH